MLESHAINKAVAFCALPVVGSLHEASAFLCLFFFFFFVVVVVVVFFEKHIAKSKALDKPSDIRFSFFGIYDICFIDLETLQIL